MQKESIAQGITFPESCTDPAESSAAKKQGLFVAQDIQTPNM